MDMKYFWDIHEVCKMLDVTSRTLRFYEEKGIIKSSKSPFSKRRQYTSEQIVQIRRVLVLRTLGLSVKAITELQKDGIDLKTAVLSRRAEILASIETKKKEIHLLNEALTAIESGKNIFNKDMKDNIKDSWEYGEAVAIACSKAIVYGDDEKLYSYFSSKLIEYMPLGVYKAVRKDTLDPLGGFVSFDRMEQDNEFANLLYSYVKYEKLGLKIKFVFYNDMIDGLWMSYYEI